VTYNTFYPDLSTPDEKKHLGDSNLLKRDRFTPMNVIVLPRRRDRTIVTVIGLQNPKQKP